MSRSGPRDRGRHAEHSLSAIQPPLVVKFERPKRPPRSLRWILATLLCFHTVSASLPPFTLNLALMLDSEYTPVRPEYLVILMALQHIRERNSSVLDMSQLRLHPNLTIEFQTFDFDRLVTPFPLAAAKQALDDAEAEGAPFSAIIGAESSNICIPIQFVAGQIGASIPQISPSCTAAILSNKQLFPSFFRMVPPDDQQGRVLAEVVVGLLWRTVAVIACDEPYSTGVADSFSTAFLGLRSSNQISIRTLLPFVYTSSDIFTLLQAITAAAAQVIVCTCLQASSLDLYTMASRNFTLTDELHSWIGPDAFFAFSTSSAARPEYTGLIGVQPYSGFGTPAYARLVSVWLSQRPENFNLSAASAALFTSFPEGSFLGQFYDTVVALALAASAILYANQTITPVALQQQLQTNFTFSGVVGQIRFDSSGDSPPVYQLMNFVPGATSADPPVPVQVGVIDATRPIPPAVLSGLRFRDGSSTPPLDALGVVKLNLFFHGNQQGRITPVGMDGADCTLEADGQWHTAAGDVNCFGGAARRADHLATARQLFDATLVLDFGTSFFGPYYVLPSTLLASIFNGVGSDVYGAGVTDFFDGPAGFASFLNARTRTCQDGAVSGIGVLCTIASDVSVASEPALQPLGGNPSIRRWIVLRVGSSHREVGILGSVITAAGAGQTRMGLVQVGLRTQAEIPGYVTDLVDAFQQMRAAHPTLNIVLLMANPTLDFEPVIEAVPEIDAVLLMRQQAGGNIARWSAESSAGVSFSTANPAVPYIVGTWETFWREEHVQLSFDQSGRLLLALPAYTYSNLTAAQAEDPVVSSAVRDTLFAANELLQRVSTMIPFLIYGDRGAWTRSNTSVAVVTDGCRIGDCPMGYIIADAVLQNCPDCWFAHLNSGAVRSSLYFHDGGNTTRGDIQITFPFLDHTSTYVLSGANILLLFNSLASQWGAGSGGDWFQVSGAHIAYTATAPYQLVYMEIRNPTTHQYETINPAQYYRVGAIDFALAYPIIATYAVQVTKYGKGVQDVLQAYLSSTATADVGWAARADVAPCSLDVRVLQIAANDTNLIWPSTRCRVLRVSQQPFLPCLANEVRGTDLVCKCIPSYTRDATGTCVACPPFMVKRNVGDHECVCDANYYNISSLTFTLEPAYTSPEDAANGTSRYLLNLLACVDLTEKSLFPDPVSVVIAFNRTHRHLWQIVPPALTCIPCPVCMTCVGDVEHLLPSSLDGGTQAESSNTTTSDVVPYSFQPFPAFWWSALSPHIYACPFNFGMACQGGAVRACLDGYEGPMCAQCSHDYGSFDGLSCDKCPGQVASVFVMVGTLIAIGIVIFFTLRSAFNAKSVVGVSTKILNNFLHVNMFIFRFQLTDHSIAAIMGGLVGFSTVGGSQSLSYNCAVNLNALDRAAVVTSIISIIFSVMALQVLWSHTCKHMRAPKVRVGVARGRSERLRRGSMSVPLHGVDFGRQIFRTFPAAVIILFMLYPAIVQESLSLIRSCWIVDGTHVMVSDVAIDCHSASAQAWIAVGYAKFIGIGIGYPALLFAALCLRERKGTLYEAAFFVRYRFMYEGYRIGYGFWEAIILLRQFFVAIVGVTLREQSIKQGFVTGIILLAALILHVHAQPFDAPDTNDLETWSLVASLFTLLLLGLAGETQRRQIYLEGSASTLQNGQLISDLSVSGSASTTSAASLPTNQHANRDSWLDPSPWLLMIVVLLHIAYLARVIYVIWKFLRVKYVTTGVSVLGFLNFKSKEAEAPDGRQADESDPTSTESAASTSGTAAPAVASPSLLPAPPTVRPMSKRFSFLNISVQPQSSSALPGAAVLIHSDPSQQLPSVMSASHSGLRSPTAAYSPSLSVDPLPAGGLHRRSALPWPSSSPMLSRPVGGLTCADQAEDRFEPIPTQLVPPRSRQRSVSATPPGDPLSSPSSHSVSQSPARSARSFQIRFSATAAVRQPRGAAASRSAQSHSQPDSIKLNEVELVTTDDPSGPQRI